MSDGKKCPFCESENTEAMFDGSLAWVLCHNCKAEGPVAEFDDEDEAVKEAIRLWDKAKR